MAGERSYADPFEIQRYDEHGRLTRSNNYGQYHCDHSPAVIWPDGTEEWWLEGHRHRSDGQPAIIRADGTKEWWWHGVLHRGADSPAIVRANGAKEWWQWGERHRDGGQPAVEHADGSEQYFVKGHRHRDGGPAIVAYDDLSAVMSLISITDPFDEEPYTAPSRDFPHLEWWCGGSKHRDDGPAVMKANGTTEWYVSGVLHRRNGPAVERPVIGLQEWWSYGKRHRVDGPAVEWDFERLEASVMAGFEARNGWWVGGALVSDKLRRAAERVYFDVDGLTDEEALELLREYPNTLIATLVVNCSSPGVTSRARSFAALLH